MISSRVALRDTPSNERARASAADRSAARINSHGQWPDKLLQAILPSTTSMMSLIKAETPSLRGFQHGIR